MLALGMATINGNPPHPPSPLPAVMLVVGLILSANPQLRLLASVVSPKSAITGAVSQLILLVLAPPAAIQLIPVKLSPLPPAAKLSTYVLWTILAKLLTGLVNITGKINYPPLTFLTAKESLVKTIFGLVRQTSISPLMTQAAVMLVVYAINGILLLPPPTPRQTISPPLLT